MKTKGLHYAAAAATAIAGVIHLAMGPGMLNFNPNGAILFLVGGAAQAFWAVPMIRRWGKAWYGVGIGGTAILSAIWIITRMLGNPITGRGFEPNSMGIAVQALEWAFIGLAAAIFPHAWLGLFSDEPQVLALGTLYLRNVAPVYGAIGLGMALYFASQGAKRVLFPVLAGAVRMIIAAFIGWSAVTWFGAGLSTLFQIVALAAVSYGLLTAAADGVVADPTPVRI